MTAALAQSLPHEAQFALFVRPQAQAWTWTVMSPEAEVAAKGEALDRESAWRCGEVAAAALGALHRAAKRRGF